MKYADCLISQKPVKVNLINISCRCKNVRCSDGELSIRALNECNCSAKKKKKKTPEEILMGILEQSL